MCSVLVPFLPRSQRKVLLHPSKLSRSMAGGPKLYFRHSKERVHEMRREIESRNRGILAQVQPAGQRLLSHQICLRPNLMSIPPRCQVLQLSALAPLVLLQIGTLFPILHLEICIAYNSFDFIFVVCVRKLSRAVLGFSVCCTRIKNAKIVTSRDKLTTLQLSDFSVGAES